MQEQVIRVFREVPVPLRDGTVCYAEIWLSDDQRPHPAVLTRTPYTKELRAPTSVSDTRLATERGYAAVIVDNRGRGSSEGVFEPFVDEEQDGFDVVEWVANQSWCDGQVVMAGTSYEGATQWLTAASGPPALRGISPVLSSDDYAEGWSYRAGVPELGFLATWCVADLAPVSMRMSDDPAAAYTDLEAARNAAPWLRDWLANGPESYYWSSRSVAGRRDDVRVPILVVGGWYDIFLSGSLASFARSTDPRDRLIVGPWGHDGGVLSHLVGEVNIGASGSGIETLFGWMLDFYDGILGRGETQLPKVRAYALGARQWVDLECWPPADATTDLFGLGSCEFAVNPDSPVPAIGGRGLLVQVPGAGYGIRDQRPLLDRTDVALAATHTVDEPILLAGPITAHLQTSSDGTDERFWVVMLCVRRPNGRVENLAEGVAAAPPNTAQVTVDLGHIFQLLPENSELLVLVAGSSFPRWPAPKTSATQRVLISSRLEVTTAPVSLVANPATNSEG